MKRILIAACSLILLLPAVSVAQTNPNTRPAPGTKLSPGRPHRPVTGGPGHGGGHRPNPGGGHRPNPGGGHRPNPGGGHHRPPHQGHRPGIGHRPGGSFVYLGHRRARFHAGLFRYPNGYAYRRWSYGQTLPSIFLTGIYVFGNYAVLGLDPPPYGYEWVRYGPDLLLVQVGTGRIVEVVQDAVY